MYAILTHSSMESCGEIRITRQGAWHDCEASLSSPVKAERHCANAGEGRQMPPAPAAASEPLPTDADGMEAYNSQMSSFFSKLSLDACEFCGRTFKPESLVKHLKGCRGPAKKR